MARKPTPKTDEPNAEQEFAGYWINELRLSEQWMQNYWTRCRRIVQRYKNDVYRTDDSLSPELRRFAILWSNIQTLGPAVYARTPEPAVSRRYRDPDKVGRIAAEVLERAIKFAVDQYDFDDRMKLSRDDYLLQGRGQAWVRYVPHTAPINTPQSAPAEEEAESQITNDTDNEGAAETTVYQEVVCDHVHNDDWGMQPCRSWAETGYVWRRVYMTKAQNIERFGKKIGAKIPLDWTPPLDQAASVGSDEIKEAAKRSANYEIWDKRTGKVIWINKCFPLQALDTRPDPLGLRNFFPCPRPIMATTPSDNYIPIPDYVYYQDQAEELDECTQRIGTLTDALRMVGIYAAEQGMTLANVFQGTNNTLIPVSNMSQWVEKGGMKGAIEWLPIDMVIQTLTGLFETRERILNDIYQITGISDIVRGDSDPNETATAQGIKAQWGSLRVRDRQKEIARFARDLIELKAEIIAEHFTVNTLRQMTNVKLLTQAEKQQIQTIQQLAQQAQQAGIPLPPQLMQQIPPDAEKLMQDPTWEEVDALLKDDAIRSFRIDVETDSTIEPNENEEKQRRIEFVTALGGLLGQALPAVQAAPQLAPLIAESVKFLTRGFRVGAQMEDVIDQVFESIAGMPPQQQGPAGASPEEIAAKQQESQAKTQVDMAKVGVEQQRTQIDAQIAQADLALRQQQLQLDAAALSRDPEPQVN
jgi:hypothetical protein